LACATFPLVWWGGFVTATGSGMAFRDWLTSDGAVLPFYPWLSSAGDKFIEHGHRLLGMLAGVLTMALVASCWMSEPRRWVRWYSVSLVAGVVVQGALGGMRVLLDERVIALVHGCVGPLFFAAAAGMVAVTSRRWTEPAPPASSPAADARLLRLAVITASLAYLQLVLGAIVRHSPMMLFDGAERMFQVAVYFHLLLAAAVAVHVMMVAHKAFWRGLCPGLAVMLATLIVAQLLLGVSTWFVKYGMPRWAVALFGERGFVNAEADLVRAGIIAGHGAGGALIVALTAVLALRVGREVRSRTPLRRAASITLAGVLACAD
jgi:cytochrome c oxidase assembly protein subunit 15